MQLIKLLFLAGIGSLLWGQCTATYSDGSVDDANTTFTAWASVTGLLQQHVHPAMVGLYTYLPCPSVDPEPLGEEYDQLFRKLPIRRWRHDAGWRFSCDR